jgi:hypothetical protein
VKESERIEEVINKSVFASCAYAVQRSLFASCACAVQESATALDPCLRLAHALFSRAPLR